MKILCTNHNDTTPSLHIYEDGAYCHVCGYRCSLEEIGYETKKTKKEPENIQDTIRYIQDLPRATVRGLSLPYDHQGLYVLWPDSSYYKRRTSYGDKTRYVGPSGHKSPLFILPGNQEGIVVVEGELNALSLKEAYPAGPTIASPGSANEFRRHIKEYLRYKKITLVLDNDPVGVVSGLETKDMLLKSGKHVTLILMDKDFNDILQESGVEGIKWFWENT